MPDKFSATVVCEYARQWDNVAIEEERGRRADSVISQVTDPSFDFRIDAPWLGNPKIEAAHFTEDSIPAWFQETYDLYITPRSAVFYGRGFLVFSIGIDVTKGELRGLVNSDEKLKLFTDSSLLVFHMRSSVDCLSDTISSLCLAANVAVPGVMDISKRYLFVDQKYLETTSGCRNDLEHSSEMSDRYNWPKLNELELKNVWEWIVGVPGFCSGETKTSVGRAIGALSYLFSSDNIESNDLALVWSLIGLEALYGDENVGMKAQLMEKSELVLGKRISHKKVFGEMYDFRSRLVHGDKNFGYKGVNGVLEEEYSYKIMDMNALASAVLIATLQYMCLNNLYDLEFQRILKES